MGGVGRGLMLFCHAPLGTLSSLSTLTLADLGHVCLSCNCLGIVRTLTQRRVSCFVDGPGLCQCLHEQIMFKQQDLFLEKYFASTSY